MKKIYSALLLGAAVAFGANADVTDICGTYTLYTRIFDNGWGGKEIYNGGAANTTTSTVTKVDENTVTISGLLPNTATYQNNPHLAVVTATYDDATKKLTIQPQCPLNPDGTPYVSRWSQRCRVLNNEDNSAPIVINVHNGLMEFENNNRLLVKGWNVSEEAFEGGVYSLVAWHMFVKDDIEWIPYGHVGLKDMSFGGGLQVSPSPDTQWRVYTWKAPGCNLYKVTNTFPNYAQATNNGFGNDWYINAVDPNFIWMPFHSAGVSKNMNASPGPLWFGTDNTKYSVTRSQAIAGSPYSIMPNMPTLENDILTFPPKWCYYCYPSDSYSPGTDWSCNGTEPITLSLEHLPLGVQTVTGDLNAPVEYFNLQGIKLTEPTKGQLLIRRQGSKTVKVIL